MTRGTAPSQQAPPPQAPPPQAPPPTATRGTDWGERAGAADVTLADIQQLRWGPIAAGTLTAAGIFILLSMIAIAVGVQAAPGVEAIDDMDAIGIIVTSAIALVSFFVGGFVATYSAGVSDMGRSLINGFLAWTLWLVAVAFLGAFGIGSIAGAMGELFGQVSVSAPDIEPTVALDSVRTASWSAFLALSLTALSSMLGSAVATRDELRGAWTRFRSAS